MSAEKRRRVSTIVHASLGIAAAAVLTVVGMVVYRMSASTDPVTPTVRTTLTATVSVYRWFDTVGTIKPGGDHAYNFTADGKVTRVLAAGTVFHPGDVIAELDGAGRFKGDLEHNKQRLSYYEHRLESMKAAGNRAETRQAEIKVAEKKRLIAEAQAGINSRALIATGTGEIAEPLVAAGATVKAGAPAVRVKATDWRAEFELSRDEVDHVRHLGFCRVELDGKPFDCSLTPEGGDETHVLIDLPSDPAVRAGKPIRLAKARYDGVFVLPATALVPTKGADRRVFVIKDGRAEPYAVVLADQTPTEIVVTQGLEPGSAVVTEVPPRLRPGATVHAIETKRQ